MLQIGRQGQLYVAAESTYNTSPTLLATHALRHKDVKIDYDNFNRRTILEKKQSPGINTAARTAQRKTAAYTLQAILRPSGTLNTLPECSPVLEAAFGSKTNVTLSTTVSSGGAVGGATLASTTGIVVGDFLLITCPDGNRRLRQILTLPGGNAVTWGPNLPSGQQPATSAAVKACTTYKLTSGLALSLTLAHYLKFTDGTAGRQRLLTGAVVDKLALDFDANEDPMFTASGPGAQVVDAGSQPGGFTMVGGQPPSGLTGDLLIGNTALKFLKLGIEISNGMWLRNDEYGVATATEAFRRGRQSVTLSLDTRAETDATLYDLAQAGTNGGLFMQTGYTEGNCLAIRCPQVEFPVPDQTDPDEVVPDSYKAMALESADAALDMIYLALG